LDKFVQRAAGRPAWRGFARSAEATRLCRELLATYLESAGHKVSG